MKFIVTGCPRTGSNLLLAGLSQNKHIFVHGEVFCGVSQSRPAVHGRVYRDGDPGNEFLNHIFASPYPSRIRAIGFKWFGDHARGDPAGLSAWRDFRNDHDIRVVFLDRNDWVAMVVCRIIAERTDTWAVTSENAENWMKRELQTVEKIEIPIPEFEKCLREIALAREMALEDSLGHPFLHLTYEQLTTQFQPTVDKVVRFLGMPLHGATQEFRKMNRKPIEERVSNFQEIQRHFASTRYGRFFEAGVPELPVDAFGSG